MKKVLVTGAAGFIGFHLSQALVNRGYSVIGIDNFTNNYSKKFKEKNIQDIKCNKNFSFFNQDITKLKNEELLKNVNFIFHLAALPGVRTSWGIKFKDYLKNNLLATQNLLELVKKSDVQKFVFASSSSIYGNQTKLPILESASKLPISPYGVTKLAAENICNTYASTFNIPIVCLRYFTVYGPRQRPDMAFNKFIKAFMRNNPIYIYGDGSQKRDFTYVQDIVNATIAAVLYEGDERVFNIGTNHTVTINDVIELLKQICNTKKNEVIYSDAQHGDVRHTYSDIALAKKALGYVPEFSIEAGLEQQYLWMKK